VKALAFSPDGRLIATASEDHTARLWDVPPIRRDDPEDLRLRVEALAGLTVGEEQDLRALDLASWADRWRDLSAKGRRPIAAPADPAIAGSSGPASEAPFDLEEARKAALREYLAGSAEGYRRRCRILLDRFEDRGIWYAAERAAKVCLLPSGNPEILARAAALAESSDRRSKGSPWAKFVVGLSQYRRGLFEASLPNLRFAREASRHFQEGQFGWQLGATSLGAEAMALARLGRTREARLRLRDAWGTLESALPDWSLRAPDPNDFGLAFTMILLREAEAVVLWDPTFPDDPFAPGSQESSTVGRSDGPEGN
jgi:hypothetical protein